MVHHISAGCSQLLTHCHCPLQQCRLEICAALVPGWHSRATSVWSAHLLEAQHSGQLLLSLLLLQQHALLPACAAARLPLLLRLHVARRKRRRTVVLPLILLGQQTYSGTDKPDSNQQTPALTIVAETL